MCPLTCSAGGAPPVRACAPSAWRAAAFAASYAMARRPLGAASAPACCCSATASPAIACPLRFEARRCEMGQRLCGRGGAPPREPSPRELCALFTGLFLSFQVLESPAHSDHPPALTTVRPRGGVPRYPSLTRHLSLSAAVRPSGRGALAAAHRAPPPRRSRAP
jgi:hypothetical protein